MIIQALHELQLHSIDRSKANAEFKETGCATFRVKATSPGEQPRILKIQKKLDVPGSDLIKVVADEINVTENRFVQYLVFQTLKKFEIGTILKIVITSEQKSFPYTTSHK